MFARPFALALAALVGLAVAADASVISIANPGGTSEIGSRLRWGGTGFEASVYDASPLNQNPTLNPSGSPAWSVGNPHAFQLTFNNATGALTLSVDFNRNSSFEAGETVSQNTFAAPGLTSYAGTGFGALELRGNESGSTGRANLSDLVINGTSVPDFVPNGALVSQFYTDGSTGLLTSLTVNGNVTFLNNGTSQERPVFDFVLRNAGVATPLATEVPEPVSMVVFAGLALTGGAVVRRRMRKAA